MKYADSGVSIDAAARALAAGKDAVRSTWDHRVKNEIGAFGGLFQAAPGEPLLVGSTDGVGTKVMIARLAETYDTVGQDLVNHCVDDILVQGAEPLFFLDYFATSRLQEGVLPQVLSGLAAACRQNGCALLGGETAEMPGVYAPGEFDLAGTIVGRVLPDQVIDGSAIRAHDAVWGLPSTGLHTNGYSLARAILLQKAGLTVHDRPAALGGASLAEVLLAVHKSYLSDLKAIWRAFGRAAVHGLAHITGGGFIDNVPRVVPRGLSVCIDPTSWPVPPIFTLMAELGQVSPQEMHRVFNMGIGMVVFTPAGVDLQTLPEVGALRIGEVVPGSPAVVLGI